MYFYKFEEVPKFRLPRFKCKCGNVWKNKRTMNDFKDVSIVVTGWDPYTYKLRLKRSKCAKCHTLVLETKPKYFDVKIDSD